MFFKRYEKQLKIFIISFYSFLLLLIFFCSNGGHFEFYHPEKEVFCIIDGKKVFTSLDDLKVPFLRFFIYGNQGMFCTYHLYYKDESGKKNNFITYKFPYKYGLDEKMETAFFVIEETSDMIKIYYNNEPAGGFEMGKNPFSKNILLEYKRNLDDILKTNGLCYLY